MISLDVDELELVRLDRGPIRWGPWYSNGHWMAKLQPKDPAPDLLLAALEEPRIDAMARAFGGMTRTMVHLRRTETEEGFPIAVYADLAGAETRIDGRYARLLKGLSAVRLDGPCAVMWRPGGKRYDGPVRPIAGVDRHGDIVAVVLPVPRVL